MAPTLPPKKTKPGRIGTTSGTKNHKVVLTGIAPGCDRYLLAKTLAGELGMRFEEARDIIEEVPNEIFPSIPETAAELFAEKIRRAGGEVETISLSMAPFCQTHPHKRARAKCKITGDYICEIEILAAGKRLYSYEGYRIFKKRRLIRTVFVMAAMVAVVAAILMAIPMLKQHRFEEGLHDGADVQLVFITDERTRGNVLFFSYLNVQSSDPTEVKFATLADVFNRDYRRYTGAASDWMKINPSGVFEIDREVPDADSSMAIDDFYNFAATKAGLERDRFDVTVFVYMLPASALPGRPEIPDLTVASGNRAIVRVVYDQPEHRDYYLAAILYGIGRSLGASRKTDDRGLAVWPEGYVEPQENKKQGQRYADVMVGGLPTVGRKTIRVLDLKNVRVGPATARELGWIDGARYREILSEGD